MKILITNDDGIAGVGLRCLIAAALPLGEVTIYAPDRERSACAHGMTMREPLRVLEATGLGCPAFAVSGLPADCVNLGLELGMTEGCDLVLSGVNAGPNLGFDTTYSGTVAGAMEGCAYGVPSVAISLAAFTVDWPLHWETAEQWLLDNLGALAAVRLRPRTFLNVNVPSVPLGDIRGTCIAPLATRIYEEKIEFRADPWGRPYYWQGGTSVTPERQPGTDVEAVRENLVAITPVTLDWTSHAEMESLATGLMVSSPRPVEF